MTPAIAYNMLFTIQILSNYIPVFTDKCVKGIIVNEKACEQYLEKNPSLATIVSSKNRLFGSSKNRQASPSRKTAQ